MRKVEMQMNTAIRNRVNWSGGNTTVMINENNNKAKVFNATPEGDTFCARPAHIAVSDRALGQQRGHTCGACPKPIELLGQLALPHASAFLLTSA